MEAVKDLVFGTQNQDQKDLSETTLSQIISVDSPQNDQKEKVSLDSGDEIKTDNKKIAPIQVSVAEPDLPPQGLPAQNPKAPDEPHPTPVHPQIISPSPKQLKSDSELSDFDSKPFTSPNLPPRMVTSPKPSDDNIILIKIYDFPKIVEKKRAAFKNIKTWEDATTNRINFSAGLLTRFQLFLSQKKHSLTARNRLLAYWIKSRLQDIQNSSKNQRDFFQKHFENKSRESLDNYELSFLAIFDGEVKAAERLAGLKKSFEEEHVRNFSKKIAAWPKTKELDSRLGELDGINERIQISHNASISCLKQFNKIAVKSMEENLRGAQAGDDCFSACCSYSKATLEAMGRIHVLARLLIDIMNLLEEKEFYLLQLQSDLFQNFCTFLATNCGSQHLEHISTAMGIIQKVFILLKLAGDYYSAC